MAAAALITDLTRKGILTAADSRRVQQLVRAHGMKLGAARFVAGETLDDCVRVLRRLDERGLHANTTLLGEAVRDESQVAAVVAAYEQIVSRLVAEQLRANVALKLTHLGLELDEELAYANVRRLVEHAERLGSFIRIDMEQSADVDAAYVRLLERSLTGPGYTAIATHDERLLEHAIDFAAREGVERSRFELQMLYGVRPALQQELAGRGFKVLVATPYGPDWYPYLMRRLAERPANALFFLRNLVRR